jgi:hypothetical protein
MPKTLLLALLQCAALGHAAAGTVCSSNFFLNSANKCQRCTYSRCEIGFYRNRCEMGSTADAQCSPCTNPKPEHSSYTTFGMPYLFNNCRWRCDDGYYKDADDNCVACATAACPNNQIRETCLPFAEADARCICPPGQFLDAATESCTTCSTDACPDGTTRQECDGTTTADAACA